MNSDGELQLPRPSKVVGDSQHRPPLIVTGTIAGFAIGLLAVAWVLANDPLIVRAKTADQIRSVSVGMNLLVAGAMPWLAQYLGTAAIVSLLAARRKRFSPAQMAFGCSIPLIYGAAWWLWVARAFWGADPIEAIAQHGSRQFAGPGFIELAGAVVNPLQLRGPWSMAGTDFFWVAASTGMVCAYWIYASRWIGIESRPSMEMPSFREIGRLTCAMMIYMSPATLVALNLGTGVTFL